MAWLATAGLSVVAIYFLCKRLGLFERPTEDKPKTIENNVDGEQPSEDNPTFTFEEPAQDKPLLTSSKPQEADEQKPTHDNVPKTPGPQPGQAPSKPRLAAPRMAPPPPTPPSNPPRLKPPTFSAMPASPRSNGSALRTPPSTAASLRVPTTKVLANTSMAPTSSTLPPQSDKKPSRKVILQPGHSPLDWALLTKNPHSQLRGHNLPAHLIRVTPSQLKQHNGRKGRDAWSVYRGKVYNITPYLPFHPGGEGELMRGAGRDAGQLFMEVHPWVNWDNMLNECMVGILVAEGEEDEDEGGKKDGNSGGLDDMD